MRVKLLGALALTMVPLAAANAMDVATFLVKADALEKKGMRALFSSDFRLLKGEIEAQSRQLRAERLAAVAAKRRPAYCPPARSRGLNSNEILASFRTIPVAQRPRTQVREALLALLVRKYPCPA